MSNESSRHQSHRILNSVTVELVHRMLKSGALFIDLIREKDRVVIDICRHRRRFYRFRYIKQASFSLLCNSVDPTLILLVLSMTA